MKLVKLDEQQNTVKKWLLSLKSIQTSSYPRTSTRDCAVLFLCAEFFQALGLSGFAADPGDLLEIFRSARAVRKERDSWGLIPGRAQLQITRDLELGRI